MTRNIKLLINFVWKFLGIVRFGNDHIVAILGYGDLKWGNITITRIYFVEGLGYNLFSVGQFCDVDLEVTFRRNTCFIRDLDDVDLLKDNRTTNLYTINLYDMASASLIYLAKNDLVFGLPKFKYAKENLCLSCEQGKSKRASHPPKPISNSKQRLHLLHMDLCGPMRVASINGKRNCYCVLHSKSFHNSPKFQQDTVRAYSRQKTRHLLPSCFGALCYTKNDREVIGKLGAKGDTGFFIGYFANYVAYKVYNQKKKKIMKTMNITLDELSAMDFKQNSSKPGLQSLTPGHISFGLKLTYAPSIITPQIPNERDLDILFEPLHKEYFGGQPSEAPRTVHVAPVVQNLQALTASMAIQDSAPTPINSSNTLNSSHNVDEKLQKYAEQQGNHTSLPTASSADNVSNAVFEGDLFVNPFAAPSTESAVSSTQYVDPSNMHTFINPWMCNCVSIIEPKTVKKALTNPAWIVTMKEERHQFITLDVWELV
nr:integrase, catalytic region, zinc finger, CCHC-type, peptidase aspartic, catalytic [Tanacetum cinerariifolium]